MSYSLPCLGYPLLRWDWAQGEVVTGWTSLMAVVLFLGAVQLFSIALIGEYLAKIYAEVKRRPRYIVEKKL